MTTICILMLWMIKHIYAIYYMYSKVDNTHVNVTRRLYITLLMISN